MTLSFGMSPDYPAGKHFPDPGHSVSLYDLTLNMSKFIFAVTMVGVACLAMLYFAKWWNDRQDKKHDK